METRAPASDSIEEKDTAKHKIIRLRSTYTKMFKKARYPLMTD